MLDQLKALWDAVLQTALRHYVDGPNQTEIDEFIRSTKDEAGTWIYSESRAPQSFIWVCEMFGLEPSAVRRQMEKKKNG